MAVLVTMVIVMFGRAKTMVPKVMGAICGGLLIITLYVADAPRGLSVAIGMAWGAFLADVFEFLIEYHHHR